MRAGSDADGLWAAWIGFCVISIRCSRRWAPGLVTFPSCPLHGTVSERVDGALRPVAGATVVIDSGL